MNNFVRRMRAQRLGKGVARRGHARVEGRRRLDLGLGPERLEDRTLLSITASLNSGVLDVQLSAAGDQAVIAPSGLDVSVSGTGYTAQTFANVTAMVVQGANTATQDVPNQGVTFDSPGSTPGTITLDAAAGTAALDVSGVTSVSFTGVTIAASSGNVDVTASETTSAAAMQATSKPDVSVSVAGATIKADNVQLKADATSSFTNSAPVGGALNNLGAATSVADLEPSASVTIQGAATTIAVNGTSGNVTIEADAGVTIGSSSTVGATFAGSAANPVDAAIAESIVNSSAVAQVGGGSTVSAGTGSGTVSITTSNTTTVTTEVDGSGAVGGATGAVTLDNSTSQASVSGGSTVTGDTVDVSASTVNTATTTAKSMATGAGPNSAIQNLLAGKVDPGYLASATPSAPDPGKKTSPAETAFSAGLPLGVAGAVAVTRFTPTTQAYVDSSTITAGGAIDIGASSDNNATTTADGEATTSNSNGSVGVGVAISDAIASNTATVENTTGTTTLTAPTIEVGATTPAASSTDAHAISATATSGASGTNVGLAGALALNIVSNTTEASVPSGSTVAMTGNVTFNAQNDVAETATAQPPVGFAGGSGGSLLGIGASVALNVADNTTLAELQDKAQLTGARNLAFTADSSDAISTNAIAGSSGGAVSISPSVGISVVNDTTAAQVGTPDAAGDSLVVGGALSATATHTATTSTPTGAGAGAGSAASAGVAIALAFVSDQTTATTGRSIDAKGGGVTFKADGSAASLVSANATATGGPTRSQESKEPNSGPVSTSEAASGSDTADPNSVDGQNAQVRNFADSESTLTDSSGNPISLASTTGDAATPAAQTSDGSITVAAAVAVNVVNSSADATIPAGLTITARGPVTVSATNDTGDPSNVVYGDTANAWGSDAGTATVGVGAAIALNLVHASTEATIGASTIHADGVTVSAGMAGTSPMNAYGAVAVSGTGSGDIGLAGAVAINIVNHSTEALIETNAAVDAGGGDVSVTALNNATDTTLAQPSGAATGSSLGIGASLALNIINETTEAEIQDGAALTNPGNVTVTAASAQTILTWGQNGAAGDVGIGAGIAIAVISDQTTAEVGSDSQSLAPSGDLTIGASGSFSANTLADAATTPGATLGLGASVAVNVAQDSFTAELNRSVDAGGAVSVTDDATSSSQSTAVASEQGASPSGTDSSTGSNGTADQETSNQFNFAGSEGGSDTPGVAAPPTANSELSVPATSAGTDSGGSKGSTKIGIAAAVAVNVLTTRTVASIAQNLTVTAGGALDVGTTNQSSALALGDGRATGNQNSIGAAVSLNVANVTNTAEIGSSDTITAAGVSVTALMTSGQANDFSTQGLGVAIGKQVGVAGSAGINVITITTLATIGANSFVNSSGGLTVEANEDETLQNIAFTLAVGSDVGAGAAINVNVLNNTTNAYLDSYVQANVSDATQVTAESSLEPSQDPVPNSPADTIIASGTLEKGKTDVGSIDGSVLGVLGGSANTPVANEPVTGAGVPIGTVIEKTDTRSFTGILTFGSDTITSDDPIFLDPSKSPKVGATVSGPGIVPGSTIKSIVTNSLGTTITLSSPVIANGSAPLGATDLVLSQAATASGPVTLVATPVDAVSQALSKLHPTNFAAGAGASSGGAGIAGSFIVNVIDQNTHAYISKFDAINTLAGTPDNVPANSDESVTVSATETMDVVDWAGALGGGDDTGIGAALDVNIVTEDARADIAGKATVGAVGNVEVTASSNGTFKSITAAVGIGGSAGIAGAASIEVLSPTTSAFIGNGTTVVTQGDLLVQASRDATINTLAGQLSGSGDASVGAAVSTIVDTVSTQAYISPKDRITANGTADGTTSPISVLVGDSAGDTTSFSGVAVVAATVQNIQAVAVGGAVSGSVGAAGSMSINVLNDTTTADIGAAAKVVATDGKPGTGPGVMVTAADPLTLLSTAGALGGGGDAGLGAGVDVDSITRNTQAYISTASVTADGDVLVQADSSGNLTSITAAVGIGNSLGIAGSAGAYVLNITTRAFIGDDPTNPTTGSTAVHAGGSILVAASESTVLDLLSGNLSGSGNLSVGAAASVPVITKTTEAFIGAGAVVNALGLGDAINAETGQFTISYQAYGTSAGEAAPPSENANLTGNGNNLTSPRLGQERIATPDTEAIHGLAVTAVNADSLQGVGVTGGASGSVAVNLSGSVAVLTNHTDAYIGSNVLINSDSTGAASSQSVLVAAGNDTSFLGIAGSLAISGNVSIAPGVVVLVVNNTTRASIDDGASVAALGDVSVVAHSGGDVLAIAAAAAFSAKVSGGGTASYVGINDTTQANIGNSATSAGTAASVDAGGNVLVDATDDTVAYLITGSLAVGATGAGLGGAVSIVDLSKTTDAFIGDYAKVGAGGSGTALTGILDGSFTKNSGGFGTLASFNGVAVQAATSENVTNVAAAGAGGLYAGLAGGVSIELFDSNTSASIGNNATVTTTSLDVAAVNQATNFSFGGGLAAGIAAIAGGVDVGILKNSTQAYIGNDAVVDASKNVDVYALSQDSVQTYALGAAGGICGAVGSVSVWSIGVPYSAGYTDGNASDSTVKGLPTSKLTASSSSAEGQTGGASTMVGALTNSSDNGAAGNTQYISGTVGDNQTGVTGSISGDPVANAIKDTTVPTGTVAFIGQGVTVGADNVNVLAKSKVSYTGLVGGLAVAAVGIGGSVDIASIQGNTQAYIDQNSTITATGSIVVEADLASDNVKGTAFAGTAGIVAVGAQVVDIQDTSTESASLNSGVTIPKAAAVQVTASSHRSLTAQALGGDIGGVVAGVGVAIANATGGPSASIGSGAQIGQSSSGTVGSVEVKATAGDTVTANSYGVAAGYAGATAVFADASASPTVQSSIGDKAAITAGSAVDVTAQDTPAVSSQALGAVLAVSVGVGAAISQANASGTTSSSLGQGDMIAAPSIDVSAMRGEDANSDPTAQSSATAGAGGILAGANATFSQATAGGTVAGSTGSSVILLAGNVSIDATNQSLQTADATGVAVGGLLAVGADVSSASSDVATSAQIGAGTYMAVNNTLNVSAIGTDENDASTTAGSGGLIAGDAAVGKSSDNSTVSTTVAGILTAGTVDISAANNSVFMPQVDSTNAGLAGLSGALAKNTDTISADTTVADGTTIEAGSAVNITAQDTFTENLPTGGKTVSAGAGGLANGTAALSTTTLTGNADVVIGDSVAISVVNPSSEGISNDGIFLIASSVLHTNDVVWLSADGAVEGAGTDSSLTATLNNGVTTNSTSANPDTFWTNENIGIGTYSTVNAANTSEANAKGVLAAVAVGTAETTVTSNQVVDLGPDTNLTAAQTINLSAGHDPTPGAPPTEPMAGDANVQSYVHGLIAIPPASATTTLTSNTSLIVSVGDQIQSGENTNLVADNTTPAATAEGIGQGFELGFIPVTHNHQKTNASASSRVTLDGSITAGVFHQLNITIPNDQSAVIAGNSSDSNYYSSTVVANGGTHSAATEPNTTLVGDPSFVPFTASFDPNFNPYNTIANAPAGTFPDSGEVSTLEGAVANGNVGAIVLGPLFAAGGDVTVNSSSLLGSGSINAYGGPTITITNNSPDYLVLSSINVPYEPGGQVFYHGGVSGAPSSITVTKSGADARPVVNVQETYKYNKQSSSAGPDGPSVFATATMDGSGNISLDPSGFIDNEGGKVGITVAGGSLIQAGAINAGQLNVVAKNGIAAFSNPKGLSSNAGTPSTDWNQVAFWPGSYDPYTNGNTPLDLAALYVAYVANVLYNNSTFGTYATGQDRAFTTSLIGHAGETPVNLVPGGLDSFGSSRAPASSLVFFGADAPWLDGSGAQDTNATASALSPAGSYYTISNSANDGSADDNAEGIFPMVPVENVPTTTAASYPVLSGMLTSGSKTVTELSSVAGLRTGEDITGTGIQPGTTIQVGTVSFQGTTKLVSNQVQVASGLAGLAVGDIVTATDLPSGTTILAVDENTGEITLSQPAFFSGLVSLTAVSVTLSQPATVSGYETNLTIGTGSSIDAAGVLINARYVDVNEPMNVGRSGNQSISLPASLSTIIAEDQLDYAFGRASTTPGDAYGYYTLPSAAVSGGDTPITAQYDAITGQIVVENVNASSGGFVVLDGAIMSTSTFGEINVNSGLGQVTIDNQTSYPVVVNDVAASKSATSAALTGVDIIDTNQPAATQQTLYVYQPGNVIDEFQGTAGQTEEQLQQGSPIRVIQGNSTSYSPEAGLRYEWQLQATMQQPNLTPGKSSTAGWGFDLTDVNGLSANNPWYFLTTLNGNVSDGTNQPTGWTVIDPGQPAFQETVSGAVTSSYSFNMYYHGGDYGFAPTSPPVTDPNDPGNRVIDPWTYLYATQAELTLTESVKADNPFGIDFSGPTESAIKITSDTPVILNGKIANPAGDTTISAPSITQSASAILTTHNLTLTSTGAVGSSTQPLDASLATGGVLNVQAGSQGVYLNLGSGALVGQITAGSGSSGHGDVVLNATGSLAVAPDLAMGTVNITGRNLTLNSSNGAIGSTAAPLMVQASGVINAAALGEINLVQQTGDFQVGQIASTLGDVNLSVPMGSIVNSSGATWLSIVASPQNQKIWSDLSLTNPTAMEKQAVATFEHGVDAKYSEYWGLLDGGSVQNGVFTLNANAVALYAGQVAAVLNVASPTDAQVQAYANSQYQSLVNFFAQNIGPHWESLPEFQAYDPSFQYVATPTQVANLESDPGWTTNQLVNSIADVALDPQNGSPVGIHTPNISGANINLVTGRSIGQTAPSITIPLADLQSGTLTAAEQFAIANATAPGDIVVNSSGAVVSPDAQVFIAASGVLNATAGGSVTIQSTAPDLTLNQVSAGGNVSITAPRSVLSTGAGTQITTPGSTVLKAGTGTLGTSNSPVVVKSGGPIHPYAPPGNTHLQVNGLSAIPVTLNAVQGQSLSSAAGSNFVVANFADSAAKGDTSQFTATIDWGDGSAGTTGIITYDPSTQQFAVESSTDHVYTTTGNYTVAVTIQDTASNASVVADSTAAIQVAELEADPSAPGGLMLAIGGTTGSDSIVVGPGAAPGETMVTLNGSALGPFSPTTRTVIFGQAGNDQFEVDAPLSVPVAIDANRTGANSLTVVGDGATDTFTEARGTITVASPLAGDTPEPITFQNIQTLTIDGGSGNSLVTIDGTTPGSTTTVNTDTGLDTVGIAGTSSPLTVNVQSAADTVNVQAIGARTTINAGSGNTTINVSSAGSSGSGVLSGIAAALTIAGGSPGSTLNISDAGDSAASTSTLTPTGFTSSAFGSGGSVDYSGLGVVNIAMGSGGNSFTVANTAPGTVTTVDSGTGSNTVNIEEAAGALNLNTQTGQAAIGVYAIGAPVAINDGGGDEVITVSSTALLGSGVLTGIAAPLIVDGKGTISLQISDASDTTASTSTLTATGFTSSAFGSGGSVDYSGLTALNVTMGSGGNTFTVAGTSSGMNTTVDTGEGSDTVTIDGNSGPLTVNTQTGTDTVNVQAIGAVASINAGGGNDVINVSSTAPSRTGVLSGIAGSLLVGGMDRSTLNISDAGDTTASTSTLTATGFTSSAFGSGGSLSYSSMAALNLLLGSGGSSGNTLDISVPAEQNLPAATNLTGGSAGEDNLAAEWASDFNGALSEQGFATTTVSIGNNFNGSMTADNSGSIATIAIGGSMTASGVLNVVNTSDPASPTSPSALLGDIGTMTVGGSLAGTVQVSGNIATLDVGPAGTATSGGVNDLSGRVLVGGQLTTGSVSGNVSGAIEETLTINSLYLGGSLTQSGLISAVNTVNPALGNINTLTIGKDLDGTLIVSGTIGTFNLGGSLGYSSSITLASLGSMTIHGDLAGTLDILGTLGNLTVDGGTPGTIEAAQIGTIGVLGGYGPIVARIEENGIQRLIEAAVPSAPFPAPAPPPAPTPAVSPAGVTFQYFYEGLDSPTVEGLSPSTNLANPQATIQVNNATGSTAADQFDLSLVTYSDTAKFNLARLDASSNSGVSGLRNVAVEGDVLTGVTASASAFFASDSNPAGVYLPQDHLAGVAVRDFLPNSSIRAATIQAVAFGSHAEEDGHQGWPFGPHGDPNTDIITGAQATGEDAMETLAAGTVVVQANDTFRVPFADLATEQSQLFVDTSPSHGPFDAGRFDNRGIVLEVQSVITADASGTANVVTQSNAARGAVTALVTLVVPADSDSKSHDNGGDGGRGGDESQGSVVQSIELYGDGGSIQSALPFATTSTITSTGPLGDLLVQGPLTANVTAPSIFGSIIPQGGAITGTIQTTGIRTDPITGLTSSVPADLGRVYVDTTGRTPILTSTIVRSFGPGLSGRIISRGNLLSQVISDGGISGVIAVQGNVGTTFTYPGGQVVRINSGRSPSILSNGPFSGQMIVLGDVIGDVTLNGGMHDGRIAVQGSILGNLTIRGSLDADSALVAGGSIGSTTYGTTLSVDNVRGIVVAVGAINVAGRHNHDQDHALDYQADDTPDEAVIDAIFSQGVSPLSPADLFDRTTPEDLLNLTQVQVNLKSLTVKGGKLVI